MKTLHRLAVLTASLLLTLSPKAHALAGDYPPGPAVWYPTTWPASLVDIAKHPSRIAGYYINQDDYFAFKGDTAGFQACLASCVALADFGPTTLHIHKGKGSFQPLDAKKPAVACDWRVEVINQEWRRAGAKEETKGPKYTLELHVWLEGGVDVASLKLPAKLKVVNE
jgi:hypothetical protein